MRELTKHFEFTHTHSHVHMYIIVVVVFSQQETHHTKRIRMGRICTYKQTCMYEHTANFRLRKLQCCVHTYNVCMYICVF